MRTSSGCFLLSLFAGAALTQCFAHSYGPPPGVTAAPGDNPKACTQCHAGTLNSFTGSVKIVLQSGGVYIPGVKQRVVVQVADPAQQRWGFQLAARLNSDPANAQAGDFAPIDNLTQVVCEDGGPEPCASGPSFIEHTSVGTRNGTKNGASFQFDWTPPSTNAGSVTFYVAGNAANGDATFNGDHIYTSSVQLDPLTPAAPSVTASNIVNAATQATGPVTSNAWVTLYGSNLGVTTRSWTDTDFNSGGMPVSLDGVSVVITAFGAPRLMYIGYVSPTQVNFLLPSDTAATTYQLQVKNPAGLAAAVPFTVSANAPQMFTVDGKHVAGTHADGSSLGTAAPGETVTLYATGCGPTNPALTPGQLPPQSFNLATLPQVTIGGIAATVTFAGVLTGAGGVYQINVQVPANTPNGDQPVVAQAGGVSTAPVLLMVQK